MTKKTGRIDRLSKEISRTWAIGWKDIKVYYLKPPTLMFGVFFPFALFFTFTIGRGLSSTRLLPLLLSQTIFWASSSVGPVVIPLERRMKTFDRYLSAPMGLISVLLGKALAGFFFGCVVSIIPLILGIFWLSLPIVDIIAFTFGILLSCLAFSAMGIMFASVPTDSVGNIMMPMNFIRIPLLFISGIFIPISELPTIGQIAAFFSPLTHTLLLIQKGLGNEPLVFTTQISCLVLVFTILIFFYVSHQFHEINKKRE